MKTITVNVSEPVYADFQAMAERDDRTASELIREAMAEYVQSHGRKRRSIMELKPVSVGKVKKPISRDNDILGEMIQY